MKKENEDIKMENYPIKISREEQDIIMEILFDRNQKIPKVWKQLVDRKNPIGMSAYELGFFTSVIAQYRDKVPDLWKQLINIIHKFREKDGVVITELGGNLIRLKDKDGISIIRPKYEWE